MTAPQGPTPLHTPTEVRNFEDSLRSAFPNLTNIDSALLISSVTDYNPRMPSKDVLAWIEKQRKETSFEIKQVPLKDLQGWRFDEHQNLVHQSGKFFSIKGVSVETNYGQTSRWSQPIIVQPEVGILGILCKKMDGVLSFLMQAKAEPGNVNQIQLSPTVQATKSNYTQVHGGTLPPYLSYFLDSDGTRVIVDQLQSEQGARFFKKRNRNVILEVTNDKEIDILPHFCWLTLYQIKTLLRLDNVVNMDARTVLSCTQLFAD